MQTRIILIRHGETDWNKERRYLSFTDIDLNDTGRAQGLAAADSLKPEKIARLYASDRKRALNSAGLLFPGMAVEPSPELREMDFGVFEGMRYEEIAKNYHDIYQAWIDDPRKTTIPSAESFDAFEARVMGKIKEIALANLGKTAAGVTHGGVVRMVLWHALKKPRFWDVKMVKPGSITIIEVSEDFILTVKQFEPENDAWPKK